MPLVSWWIMMISQTYQQDLAVLYIAELRVGNISIFFAPSFSSVRPWGWDVSLPSSRIVTLISRVNKTPDTIAPPLHCTAIIIILTWFPATFRWRAATGVFLQISANISPLISSVKELGVWLLLIARFYHREDHNLWGFKFLFELMGKLRHEEGITEV